MRLDVQIIWNHTPCHVGFSLYNTYNPDFMNLSSETSANTLEAP
jgi:hypothetical protein